MEDELARFVYLHCDEPIDIVNWLNKMMDDNVTLVVNSLRVIPTYDKYFAFIAVIEPLDENYHISELEKIEREDRIKEFIAMLENSPIVTD